MPFKVMRIDESDSFFTKFIVYKSRNEQQEFNIPKWDADDFELKVSKFTNIDFQNFIDKSGMKNARPDK